MAELPEPWQSMPAQPDPLAALRAAQALDPTRDLLLISADALLPDGWWLRLMTAVATADRFDVISAIGSHHSALDPFAQPATEALPAFADPDALCWLLADHSLFDCALASCGLSWWRAGVCLPDAQRWNDRVPEGLHGAVLPCLYIAATAGERSTPAAAPLPVAALAERIAERAGQPARRPGCNGKPVVLHIVHGWGGGAWQFVRDMMSHEQTREHLVLVSHGDPRTAEHGQRIALHADLDAPAIADWTLPAAISDTAIESPAWRAILDEVIADWGIGAVLVSSLIGHSLDALRSGLPTSICCHDAYPLWPYLADNLQAEDFAFDVPALEQRLAENAPAPFRNRDPAHWAALRSAYLNALQQHDVLLVAPSLSSRDSYWRLAAPTRTLRWQIIGHGSALPLPAPSAQPPTRTRLRVLVPGRIANGKGEQLLLQLAAELTPELELILLGCGSAGMAFFARNGVQVQLNYRHADLPTLVSQLAPDLALLPSTVAETWSYTLSEMWQLGIPVLATALGSLRERIVDGETGLLVAANAEAVRAVLIALAHDRSRLQALQPGHVPTLDTALAGWRDALPAPVQCARIQSQASAQSLARHSLQCEHGTQRRQLLALGSQHRALQIEFDRRSAWAISMEQQLAAQHENQLALQQQHDAALVQIAEYAQRSADMHKQLIAQHLNLAKLTEQYETAQAALAESHALAASLNACIANNKKDLCAMQDQLDNMRQRHDSARERLNALEDALNSAHQFYQRDTGDLAQQRNVALAQRDQLQRELDTLLESHSWRLTRPLRGLRRILRTGLATLTFRFRVLASLVRRSLASLRTRGLRVTSQRVGEYLARKRTARNMAPTGDASVHISAAPVAVPCANAPVASIIIPAFNHVEHTLTCLAALASNNEQVPFEIIVVDDHSSDDTPIQLAAIRGLRLLRNASNLGFIGACNAGARQARGRYLVFLNNDTRPLAGWLDALIDTFAQRPDAGLVGAKLIYPDGRLQEAGGIVFNDGSGWNYGRFQNPADPRFNFVREVDYCSGAAIAIEAGVFAALDGFDSYYAPAYYEDTDLAMRIRRIGKKVYYQPKAEVIHDEGVTSGTDLGKGVKAFQVENQARFLARWRQTLQRSHRLPGSDPARAAARDRVREVLIIDACTPTPDRDSGSLRMLNLMRLLLARGCAVSFLAENPAHGGRYTEAMQQLGVEAWWHPWLANPAQWMSEHGRRFDTVIVSRHYVASAYLPLLRQFAPRAQILFDTVDLHYLREQREAELSGDAAQTRAAATTRERELRLVRDTDITLVVSPFEQALLQREVPGARIEVLSNVHAIAGCKQPFSQRNGLLFVGGYRHPPNVDAANWLAQQIFPRVRQALPDIELHLIGGDAPDSVRALGDLPGVHFHGHVPDIEPFLDGCRIALAPLRYGAGVKGKVNLSMAHGQPVVATPCAAEGMSLRDGHDVLIAEQPQAIADAIVRLYRDQALWAELSRNGLDNVRQHYSFEAAGAALARILEPAGQRDVA
jgi:GT2 family glycosyltransferase